MAQTGETISVLCGCGKKLKAPATAVGRKAKCPGCGNVLTIEAPAPPPVEEDDPLGAMYDLAEAEKAAADSNQIDDAPRCPKCGASMQAGAVLCVSCGYDLRSASKLGRVVSTKPVINPELAKAAAKKPVDKMAPQGSFFAGLGLSVALSLAGGLIWFFVTWGTGWDIYIVCMLIGVGAGAGMQIGQKGYSNAGGWAAAGVTLLVLLLARLAVVVAVLLPTLRRHHVDFSPTASAQTEFDSDDHDELVQGLADESLEKQKIDPEKATDTQREIAEKAAERKVFEMTRSQRISELKRIQAKADGELVATAEAKTPAAKSPAVSSAKTPIKSAGPNVGAAIGMFVVLLLFFGWKSSIFMILTLGIAYRTASGSVST